MSRRSVCTTRKFLVKHIKDDKLRLLLLQLADCCKTIAYKVRTASCGKVACVNAYGDEQLAVDMIANKCLLETLEYSGVCECAVSEEEPEVVPIEGVTDGYSVAFDPLDGSSIIDTNFAVGTIFGIWPGSFAKTIPGITGRDQSAAGVCVYGPRTCLTVAFKHLPGCFEFQLQDDGKFILVKDTFQIHEGKMFSPGNLRATFDNPEYEKLVNYWINEQYTLRYTGGMVPDVFQIIVKEKGVFSNVTSPTTKAKLRLCFEVAPLGLLVEKAGGFSSADGQSISSLDVEIKEIDQRTQVCYGSYNEVCRFEEYLYGGVSPRLVEANPNVTA